MLPGEWESDATANPFFSAEETARISLVGLRECRVVLDDFHDEPAQPGEPERTPWIVTAYIRGGDGD